MSTKRISKKQNKQIMGLEIFLLILFTAAVAVMGVLLYRSMHKKNGPEQNSSAEDTSSVIEVIPEDTADTSKLAEHFAYISLPDFSVSEKTLRLRPEVIFSLSITQYSPRRDCRSLL